MKTVSKIQKEKEAKDMVDRWFSGGNQPLDNSKNSDKFGKSSTIALVVANLFPVFGLLYGGYSIDLILGIYWFESAIIALYTIMRIYISGKHFRVKTPLVLVAILFFLIHFGLFMLVHLFFIGFGLAGKTLVFAKISVLAIFLSHGFSFLVNFVGKREYETVSIIQIMKLPYKRIFVMQFIIAGGGLIVGGLSLVLHTEIAAAIGIVIIKTFIDIQHHRIEHIALIK